MIVFDFIFLKTYQFVLRQKKDSGDSKWSSFLFLSTYLACIIIFLISFFGLLIENLISDLFKHNPLEFWMATFILSPILLSYRYYKLKSIIEIENKYNKISERNKILINWTIYFLMVGIPIVTFVFFRLFVIGQLRW